MLIFGTGGFCVHPTANSLKLLTERREKNLLNVVLINVFLTEITAGHA